MSSAHAFGRMAEENDRKSCERRRMTAKAREIKREDDERRRQEDEPSDLTPNNVLGRKYSQRRISDVSDGSISSSAPSIDSRDLRSQLDELLDKYNETMKMNAQLENENEVLRYDIETLRDKIEDMEDNSQELLRNFSDKKRECSFLKSQYAEAQHQTTFLRNQVEARERLIVDRGLILVGQEQESLSKSEPDAICPPGSGMALLSQTLASRFKSVPGDSLEAKLQHLMDQLEEANTKIAYLREENELRADANGRPERSEDAQQSLLVEQQRDVTRQLNETKYKLQQSNQRITSLEGDVIRLESQAKRFSKKAEEAERDSEAAKNECRQHKRECREQQSEIEDLKSEINSLKRANERLKNAKSLLAAD